MASYLKSFNDKEDYPFKVLDRDQIFCKVCERSFVGSQKSQFQQHMKTERHQTNCKLKTKRTQSQAQLEDFVKNNTKKSRSETVGKELCRAFLAANIPWKKLENPELRGFLEKELAIQIPDESTLRKSHLPACYAEVVEKIREDLQGAPLWIEVDETTDATGRYVGNVLLGKLDDQQYHPPYLANCAFLDKCDSGAIARLINDTLRWVSPNFDSDLARILISDAAPYMVKAGSDLKTFFPNLLHITCLAHALHRVCEKVLYYISISIRNETFLKYIFFYDRCERTTRMSTD